jgi:opacity protein-like surface antigen
MIMKSISLGVIAAVLMAPALAAGPDELRYGYLDINLTGGEVDDLNSSAEDIDAGQFAVGGSIAVANNIAIFGGLSYAVVDFSGEGLGPDQEITAVEFGINPHFSIAPNVDLIFPVSILRVDYEYEYGSEEGDDTGFTVGAGVRALLSPSWELEGLLNYTDIFDDDFTTLSGSVRWHMASAFSMSLGLSASDDSNSSTLGFRFTFGDGK